MTYGNITQAAVGTAVIADTADAIHLIQNPHQARQEAEAQAQYQQPQYCAAPGREGGAAELQQLAGFYNRGLLSEAEYAAARQKLLAG
jgi:hypothetical protein